MQLPTPLARTVLAIAIGLTASASANAARVHDQDALTAKPACVPQPAMLGLDRSGPVVAPDPGALERSSGIAGRFLAQGQQVRYSFDCEQGELTLFELAAAGYARGWQAGGRLRVLDGSDQVLAEQSLAGGVVFRPFLAFQAPTAGTYQLEITAQKEFFRYALVRHSDYAPRTSDEVLAVGERTRVHGWISGGADRMRFTVPVRAGEELALRVEGTREQSRNERRALTAAAGGNMGGRMQGRMEGGQRGRGRGPDKQFPVFVLELEDESAAKGRSSTFARLIPTADGLLEIGVRGAPGDQGGLFDLVVVRDSPKQRVHGLVVDDDEEPLARTTLTFRLEPDLEPWGEVTTDANGAYALEIPTGNYVVDLKRPDQPPHAPLKAGVQGDLELNVIW